MLRHFISKFIKLGLIIGLMGFARPALAIPTLQLDIGGGAYDSTTQTIVASTNPFTLYAYLIPNSKNTISDYYYISMAVAPKVGPLDSNLGSFTFNSTTVNVTADMIYGVPPLETFLGNIATPDSGDLSKHGIFQTYFYEYEFQFSSANLVNRYDTQTGETQPGYMYYYALTIDTSLLDPNYVIHFDLYNTKLKSGYDIDITQFAPFSHDAQSCPNCNQVPEPSTLLLLGSGLAGLAFVRRIRFKK